MYLAKVNYEKENVVQILSSVLKDIIDENNKNYTEAEKDAAQKELDRVNELIDSIEEVEEVLSKLEETENSIDYWNRFILRPMRNLLTGSRDFDKEFQGIEFDDEEDV